MNLQRLWRVHVPAVVRHSVSVPWLLLVCGLVLLLLLLRFLQTDSGLSFNAVCQSELNLRHYGKNGSGLHVIPSTPGRSGSRSGHVEQTEMEGNGNPWDSECVDVYTPGGYGPLLICIHDPKKDLMVSAHLKNEGSWESENVELLYRAHRQNPQLVLVDLGCNIGVFTLPAAKFGMEVISVDAMMASLQLLQRSLFINGLSCHVTLLRNAVHRTRKKMRVNVDPTNIGGSVVAHILESRKHNIPQSHVVDAICLDDLVPLVQGKQVFLKLDLEGSEAAVLECAEKFFTQVDVRVILLEWMYFRHQEEASRQIKDFMVKHGMVPTWQLDRDREIDPFASNSWPDNVIWMKQ